jgi:hypothetical protein
MMNWLETLIEAHGLKILQLDPKGAVKIQVDECRAKRPELHQRIDLTLNSGRTTRTYKARPSPF